MNGKPDLRQELAYHLGKLEGFDDGFQKASAQYMSLIRKILGVTPLTDKNKKQEEENGA